MKKEKIVYTTLDRSTIADLKTQKEGLYSVLRSAMEKNQKKTMNTASKKISKFWKEISKKHGIKYPWKLDLLSILSENIYPEQEEFVVLKDRE